VGSQFGEDVHIARALDARVKKNDRFLDIGAFHPVVFSNTRQLVEAGWSGVMIEPSPLPMEKLLREYGTSDRFTLIQAAVGLDPTLTKLHVTEDALSTTSEEHKQKWTHATDKTRDGGYYGAMYVPQITLAELFEAFPANFDFVSIDTEGTSIDLLKEMFRLGVHPWCVCFEHDGRYPESSGFFEKEGYFIEHENDCNRVIRLRG
jgi:FkbM family methyltransferase